jgi:protein-S-isoprenylcysteine O-methyltransferase Ste14
VGDVWYRNIAQSYFFAPQIFNDGGLRMKTYRKWAGKEYSLFTRLITTIPAGILLVLFFPYLLAFPAPRLDSIVPFPSLYFGTVNLVLGICCIAIGGFYAFWSVASQFIYADGTPLPMMPTQKLLVMGPFRQCRNPMTFGTVLVYLGIGIIVGSPSSIFIALMFGGLLLAYIKLIEEKELAERFGQEYLEYKAVTPLLIPRIFRRV